MDAYQFMMYNASGMWVPPLTSKKDDDDCRKREHKRIKHVKYTVSNDYSNDKLEYPYSVNKSEDIVDAVIKEYEDRLYGCNHKYTFYVEKTFIQKIVSYIKDSVSNLRKSINN